MVIKMSKTQTFNNFCSKKTNTMAHSTARDCKCSSRLLTSLMKCKGLQASGLKKTSSTSKIALMKITFSSLNQKLQKHMRLKKPVLTLNLDPTITKWHRDHRAVITLRHPIKKALIFNRLHLS